MKKALAIMLALIMVIALCACGSGSSTSTSTSSTATASQAGKDTLIIVTDSDLGNMGPFGSGNSFAYFQEQVYEELFMLGYDMAYTPRLAESWDKVDDTHYTFHLRSGLKDSAGNPLTASDVLFSMNLYTTDASYSQYVAHVDFEKTVATDDLTLDVYFADTNAFAFSQLAGVRVVTKAAWEASPDQMVSSRSTWAVPTSCSKPTRITGASSLPSSRSASTSSPSPLSAPRSWRPALPISS